jgi:hypothetical protein
MTTMKMDEDNLAPFKGSINPRRDALAHRAKRVRALAKDIVRDVATVGRHLTKAKEIAVTDNTWLEWLNENFGWSDEQALIFMRVHETSKSRDDFQRVLDWLNAMPVDDWAIFRWESATTRLTGHTEEYQRQAQRMHSPSKHACAARQPGAGDFPARTTDAGGVGCAAESEIEKWWPIIKAAGIKGE